jgi:hypothetical protein
VQRSSRRAFHKGDIVSMSGVVQRHRPGHAGDSMLRNVNTGAFEVYDIAGNQLTDAVSLSHT